MELKYDHIVVRYGELSTKGKNKKDFTRKLTANIKNRLKDFEKLEYKTMHDGLFISLNDENYEEILKSVEESYQLEEKTAEKLYRHLWIYTHGIASLCATKVCRFTGEEIENMLIEVFTGLYEKVKRDGNSNFS